jgi:hypothetical protein
MTTLTIALTDEQWQKLYETANKLKLTPEELIQANIQDLIDKSETDFNEATDFVLTKNAELYRKLA